MEVHGKHACIIHSEPSSHLFACFFFTLIRINSSEREAKSCPDKSRHCFKLFSVLNFENMNNMKCIYIQFLTRKREIPVYRHCKALGRIELQRITGVKHHE